MKKRKLKVGFYGLTGCAGCQLSIIFEGDELLNILGMIEIQAWPFIKEINLEEKYDAILIHSEGLGNFFTLKHNKIPIFCYCHTPVRSVYDPVYIDTYLKNNPNKKYLLKIFSIIYRYFDKKCWNRYDKVFVNSLEVKKRLLDNN